jgi:hypothetical protein
MENERRPPMFNGGCCRACRARGYVRRGILPDSSVLHGDYYDVGPLPDERIEIFLRGRER